ncbi:peptidase MA superfamily protein, partial [Vibrio parahaemolyticus EKP-028]
RVRFSCFWLYSNSVKCQTFA